MDGGILGVRLERVERGDSGDSCLVRAWAAGEGCERPLCGIPRRDAISRASDGEEARAWLSVRAAASAEVGGLCFVAGFVEGGEIGWDDGDSTMVGCSTTDSCISGVT